MFRTQTRGDLLRKRDEQIDKPHATLYSHLGFPVDRNIANLVHAVNALGLTTQFSCEGSPELIDYTGDLSNRQEFAHLIFPRLEDGFELLRIISSKEGSLWTEALGPTVSLSLMIKNPSDRSEMGARAIVHFMPRDIDKITAAISSEIAARK